MDRDASNSAAPAALMAGRAASVQAAPGQMHRHGVNVDAGDRLPPAVEDFPGFPVGCRGGGDEVGHRLGHEGAGAAGRVQHALVQRVVHQLLYHGAGQPCGGVVLPQLPPLLWRYDRLVQGGGGVRGGLGPVEAGHPAGQGLQQRVAADLIGPGEEVRFEHPLQPRAVAQLPTLEQVGGVVGGQLADVDTEGGLHHHADDGAQVGVADEQVVHLLRADANLRQSRARLVAHPLRAVGDFAQGGAQQVIPQPPLDPDGLQSRVLLVEGLEGGDVAQVGGAARAEMPTDSLSIGTDALQGYQGRIPQPLPEGETTHPARPR